jgi:hypothetical protein
MSSGGVKLLESKASRIVGGDLVVDELPQACMVCTLTYWEEKNGLFSFECNCGRLSSALQVPMEILATMMAWHRPHFVRKKTRGESDNSGK